MAIFRGKKIFDDISGTNESDVIIGRDGDDRLQGGQGADLLKGGKNDDMLVFERALNLEEERNSDYYDGGENFDTLELRLTAEEWSDPAVYADIITYLDWLETADTDEQYTFGTMNLRVKSIEAVTIYVEGGLVTDPRNPTAPIVFDLGASSENETVAPGGDLDYVITTGSGDDTVTTGGGADTISTGEGDDEVRTGGGDDTISIGNGDDIVQAGAGNDEIIAGMGGGVDVIDGGPGNDTVRYPSATNPINIDLRAEDRSAMSVGGGATVGSTLAQYLVYSPNLEVGIATGADIDTDILISIENAEGGSGGDTLIGNEEANRLRGMDGNDMLSGNGGQDTLEGGDGEDMLDGGSEDDRLEGGFGNDIIDGGTGFDTVVFSGDRADYTFVANNDGTFTVTDNVAGRDGVDTIFAIERVAFADQDVGLWAIVGSIDRIGTNDPDILVGTAAREWFVGLDGDDQLYGDAAEDTFIPGQGDDFVDGGTGTDDDANFVWDIINYFNEYVDRSSATGTGVYVDLANEYAIDTYGDRDTLIDIERIFGTPDADILIGSDERSEAFDPWGGADEIHGGGGFDNLRYNLAAGSGYPGGVTVTFSTTEAGSGLAIDMTGATDVFTGIESVTATEFDDILIGGLGDQFFTALDGSDYIEGGADFDRSTYRQDASYGGNLGVVMLHDADGGERTITDGWGNTDTLLDIEWIVGTGVDDTLYGNNESERLEGLGGDDNLRGFGGNDTLLGGDGGDVIIGDAGNDIMEGGAGNDALTSAGGIDILTGGLDADDFAFNTATEHATVTDFSIGEDDLVFFQSVSVLSVNSVDADGNSFDDALLALSNGGEITLLDVDVAAIESYLGLA